MIAEPRIKTCKCWPTIFLPIALAATSLSLIALNILPQGEFKASWLKKNKITRTEMNKPA